MTEAIKMRMLVALAALTLAVALISVKIGAL